jgi:hypothetical protein
MNSPIAMGVGVRCASAHHEAGGVKADSTGSAGSKRATSSWRRGRACSSPGGTTALRGIATTRGELGGGGQEVLVLAIVVVEAPRLAARRRRPPRASLSMPASQQLP